MNLTVEKSIELVKPFVGSLRGKNHSRPVLKAALVTPEYVIATDSHRLIRVKHAEKVTDKYLHHFKKDISGDYPASSYPETARLIPDKYNAKTEYTIDIAQWLEIHTAGLVAANENDRKVIELRENVFEVKPVTMKAVKGKKTDYSSIKSMKGYKDVPVPEFDQLSYKYTLGQTTGIDYVAYNCQYMIDCLKVFKKLKINQVKLYFFGAVRPMLIESDDIEIILLPVRKY